MRLVLQRLREIDGATLGRLAVCNGPKTHFICATLEPKVRDKKIKGQTAIPAGEYRIKYSPSQKYGKNMPFLLNVPNFTGIMIHTGNELKDTEGCILVGYRKYPEKAYLYSSRKTFDLLDTIIGGEKDLVIRIYDIED